MRGSSKKNVLHVYVRRLCQLRETSIHTIEPYFKISIGEGAEQRTTSIGRRLTDGDDFIWEDTVQFSFEESEPPTELRLNLKRKRIGRNRAIAFAILPLRGIMDPQKFNLSCELKDAEGIVRALVELVIWLDEGLPNHRHASSMDSLRSSNGEMVSPITVGQAEMLRGTTWRSSDSGLSQLTVESGTTVTSSASQASKDMDGNAKTYGQTPSPSLVPNARPLPLQKHTSSPMQKIQELEQVTDMRRQASAPTEKYPRIVDDGSVHGPT